MIIVVLSALVILGLLLGAVLSNDYKIECTVGLIFVGGMLLVAIGMIIGVGANTCPELMQQRLEVESLASSIELVKSSRYDDVKSGNLVGGSLDNMEIGKSAMNYLTNYAKKKAEYNAYLAKVQYKKRHKIFSLFGVYFVVPKEVLDIKPL